MGPIPVTIGMLRFRCMYITPIHINKRLVAPRASNRSPNSSRATYQSSRTAEQHREWLEGTAATDDISRNLKLEDIRRAKFRDTNVTQHAHTYEAVSQDDDSQSMHANAPSSYSQPRYRAFDKVYLSPEQSADIANRLRTAGQGEILRIFR